MKLTIETDNEVLNVQFDRISTKMAISDLDWNINDLNTDNAQLQDKLVQSRKDLRNTPNVYVELTAAYDTIAELERQIGASKEHAKADTKAQITLGLPDSYAEAVKDRDYWYEEYLTISKQHSIERTTAKTRLDLLNERNEQIKQQALLLIKSEEDIQRLTNERDNALKEFARIERVANERAAQIKQLQRQSEPTPILSNDEMTQTREVRVGKPTGKYVDDGMQ